VSASERHQRVRDAVVTATPTTWALSAALTAVVVAEALVAFGNNVTGSIASGVVLEGLVVACVLTARGAPGGRSLPPLSGALLVLCVIPLQRLASLALPAHELPRSTWPAVVGAVLLIAVWRIASLAGQHSLRARLQRPVREDALLVAGAVPVGVLWFGVIGTADARLPNGALAIAAAVVMVAFAALAEEIVFRGVLLDALTRASVSGSRSRLQAESPGANVIASAAYAAACLGWPMPYPLIAFLAALVLGRTALHRRSVTGVAIAHFVAWSVAVFIAPALLGASTSGFLL
jgi:membrane protease YdiL (CAAX protease family)